MLVVIMALIRSPFVLEVYLPSLCPISSSLLRKDIPSRPGVLGPNHSRCQICDWSASVRFATAEVVAWSTASLHLDRDAEHGSDPFINTDTATPKGTATNRATRRSTPQASTAHPRDRGLTTLRNHPCNLNNSQHSQSRRIGDASWAGKYQ
ncbi:unnamed protein product [Penicillium egyptiacum]|uniref:Secreted protein n=1 Tax=Penicillium egyptiacum TaxID=1303716 RepID=A0A9W4KHN7_9EURO|nr:unnamed protein product [Penicillium egyptiacum]